MNWLAIQKRASTSLGGKHLVVDRVEYDSGYYPVAMSQGERHVPHREPMREVGGSIQRVHKPAVLGVHLRTAAFLGNNPMIREQLVQALYNQTLTGPVCRRNQIIFTLQFKSNTAVAQQDGPRFARDLHRRVKKFCHKFLYSYCGACRSWSCTRSAFGPVSRLTSQAFLCDYGSK